MAALVLMLDRSTFVVAVVLQLLTAQLAHQASMRSPTSSLFVASSADTIKLDVGELRKLGISPDDLLRHIRLLVEGRLGDCVDRASRTPSPARVQPSPVDNSAAAVGAGGELRRQFVRNKTVTCNDGSKAGYVQIVRRMNGSRSDAYSGADGIR